MAITAILFDLGNTLVEQRVDSDKPLDRMRLVLLPGVKETLPILYTKYKLAVLSNTSRSKAANVTEALEKLSVRRYFSEIVTSIDVGAEKPNPRIFEAVLRRLGVKPDQALMIGNDLVQDIEGAKAIGLRTGWFTGTPKHHVDSADFSFSDFGDLPQLIAALEQSSGGYRDDKHSRRKSS